MNDFRNMTLGQFSAFLEDTSQILHDDCGIDPAKINDLELFVDELLHARSNKEVFTSLQSYCES